LNIFREAFGQTPLAFEAIEGSRTVGYLPLVFVRSTLFGRFLASMPYLNSGGVVADRPQIATQLLDAAVSLAKELRVKHLELRHEKELHHPALNASYTHKVHMRLRLPDFPGPLWESLKPSVRNLVRKGEKHHLTVHWGTHDLLNEFYDVFSVNMRDLGTPVYSRKFFRTILKTFPNHAELCVVRLEDRPISGGLILHGKGISEIPSASSLREFNHTSANMLMYWKILERCMERGQSLFDFGRSSKDSGTYKFKKQWGAEEHPACWQYHLLRGKATSMRPDNPKYQKLIAMWQKMPVWLTRMIGPSIVRGIP
jgi:FemAB-related protein (PEP-CTERM system-associated)